MSKARAEWEKLAARFNAYSQRERALVAAAVIGGVLVLGFSLFVDPNLSRAKVANRLIEQQKADLVSVEAQMGSIKTQLQVDPDAGRKAEIAKLQSELVRIESAVKNLEGGLVPPAQMNAVLERLLAGNTNLRLLSLKSLAPVNLADAGKAVESGKPAETAPATVITNALGLYKHGVEVRLEGGYSDLHTWLTQLENTQQKILWGDVRLQVADHPRAVMVLTIFTLSTDKAWLAI
jgi:MSHA biogenesis protein MshJ